MERILNSIKQKEKIIKLYLHWLQIPTHCHNFPVWNEADYMVYALEIFLKFKDF